MKVNLWINMAKNINLRIHFSTNRTHRI